MTDRYNGFVVVLESDIREDDATSILTALKTIKGVLRVAPITQDIDSAVITRLRVNAEWTDKLVELINERRRV